MKDKGRSAGLYHYSGLNPFKDSQSRTFSDEKVIEEFCPTSAFWSLFNDQHEVLLGTRGSGKTILLKMMRFSLLKKMKDVKSRRIVTQKRHIGMYVPLNLEFLGSFTHQEIPEKVRLPYFQFSFNCLLAQSFLYELGSIIEEAPTFVDQVTKSSKVAALISTIWFPQETDYDFSSLEKIKEFINRMYYTSNVSHSLHQIPRVFTGPICSPVQSVKQSITAILDLPDNVNWLVCIDEAEFLDEVFQKCINTVFRSDSRGVVIKMATLPFKHITKETLSPGVYAEANGNDFNYTIIDMKHDQHDFINVTNKLCAQRISKNIPHLDSVISLDSFVSKVGNDDLIDYFCEEKGIATEDLNLEAEILTSLATERQVSSNSKDRKSIKKPIVDRFAPIYFWREMFKLSRKGNHTPGWLAGPKMIRRMSEGNPRFFLQLMNDLFEYCRDHSLSCKGQHKVSKNFASRICEATKGLPIYGPNLSKMLENISHVLHLKTHADTITDAGSEFVLSKGCESNLELVESIKLGIQYARLTADAHTILDGISETSIFSISNCYCAANWIPMRKGARPVIDISCDFSHKYKKNVETQGTLFQEL